MHEIDCTRIGERLENKMVLIMIHEVKKLDTNWFMKMYKIPFESLFGFCEKPGVMLEKKVRTELDLWQKDKEFYVDIYKRQSD